MERGQGRHSEGDDTQMTKGGAQWKEGSKGCLGQCARHVLKLRAGKHLLFGERIIVQCDERTG